MRGPQFGTGPPRRLFYPEETRGSTRFTSKRLYRSYRFRCYGALIVGGMQGTRDGTHFSILDTMLHPLVQAPMPCERPGYDVPDIHGRQALLKGVASCVARRIVCARDCVWCGSPPTARSLKELVRRIARRHGRCG